MAHQLRKYQREASDAPYSYWSDKPEGNPLIVLPTGGGKSLVLGTITQEFIDIESTTRILMATHVKELIEQNYEELMGFWPWAPSGIYSASIGRKDASAQVLFGGIASMFRNAAKIGHVDILIIDEAHMVPFDEATMYRKFIKALKAINPRLLVLGLTATPYRLDGGMLTEGDDRLFDDIIYEISIRELIELGYLCPLVSKATATQIDMKGLRRSGGDFTQKSLDKVIDQHPITAAAVDEVISFATSNEKPRRSWLFFCTGVKHAEHVRDEIRSRGYSCECITGETEKGDRKRIINDFKAGKITALTNANVLTTGFNAPRVDLLAMLRPTDSTALYVQMVGRGTRCMGKDIEESIRNGKSDCLVLDFAGNVRRHGPVDAVKVKKPGKGEGDAPVKECPDCHSLIFAGLSECPDCGHVFERDIEKKITKSADHAPIISGGKSNPPTWVPVTKRTFYRHDKVGGTPSIRVEYQCGSVVHKEWICPQHQGYARLQFEKWWARHSVDDDDAPFTIEGVFAKAQALRQTAEIMIKANGKHWQIEGRKLGEVDESKPALPPPMPGRAELLMHNATVARPAPVAASTPKPWEKRTTLDGPKPAKPVMPGRASVTQLANNGGFSPWEQMQKAHARGEPWNAGNTPPVRPAPDFDDDIPF
jgi:DNA repair protein RadD